MTDDSPPKCRSIIEPNSRGIASLANGNRICVISHIVHGTGMLEVRDVEDDSIHTIHRQQFSMANNIPSLHRKAAFDLVAPYWAAALTSYPKNILIEPSGLSIVTLARKIREARVGKTRYGWLSHQIDEALWAKYSDLISITETVNGILMGSREHKNETATKSLGVIAATEGEITFTATLPDDIERFCMLKSNKCFKPEPAFVVTGLSPEQIQSLESRYDIGFLPYENQPNKWRVI